MCCQRTLLMLYLPQKANSKISNGIMKPAVCRLLCLPVLLVFGFGLTAALPSILHPIHSVA